MCLLSKDIYEYNYVSQGKVDIPGVDDGEESKLTDVSKISVRSPPSVPSVLSAPLITI